MAADEAFGKHSAQVKGFTLLTRRKLETVSVVLRIHDKKATCSRVESDAGSFDKRNNRCDVRHLDVDGDITRFKLRVDIRRQRAVPLRTGSAIKNNKSSISCSYTEPIKEIEES